MYSVEAASKGIGKRVIVSIRVISAGQEDTFLGYWGTIDSVYDDGMLVLVEGGSEEQFETLPPSLDLLEQAEYPVYQLNEGSIVENVDYEVRLVGSDNLEDLTNGN